MANEKNETLGQVIKKKRTQLGMSLRDLAKASNVHHSTIDRIENDLGKVVDPATLVAIAKTLHLDHLYLLSLNGAGVEDDDIRIIARMAGKLDEKQRKHMMEVLRASFTDAFDSSGSDDLDENGEEYLDERI